MGNSAPRVPSPAGSSVRPRRTLAAPSEVFAGVGLHSGRPTAFHLLPAPPGAGVIFHQRDAGQEIPARAENVVDTSRCTVLGAGGATVQTVEHLLSALAGLGVEDARVELSGGEVPVGDGSAAPFVALVRRAGLVDAAGTEVRVRALSRPLLIAGDGGSTLAALPAPSFRATVLLDYPEHPWIGTQAVEFDPASQDYAVDVAPARTYGFLGEIAWLQARGLALGASRENGIALREDGYDAPLRFDDELARHKLLDLIGDLSLVGVPLAAHVIAVKPSHALNCRFASLLAGGPV